VEDLATDFAATIGRHLDVYGCRERLVARQLGLHPSDVRCLREFREGSQLPVGGLRRRLGISQSQLSRALGRLESAGLVVRRIDPRNHRCVLVDVTRRGSDAVLVLDRQLTQAYRAALGRLPRASAESTLAGLRSLLANLVPPADEEWIAGVPQASANH
jgi:DNA-binding MarR family transcriptional regulator